MESKDIKQINFKQLKYVIPAIVYVGVLFLGFMAMQIMHTDTSGKKDFGQTTDYLNSDLPSANTDSLIGDKMDNSEKEYGDITDLSGVNTIENDNDSVTKTEDYESRYNSQEAARVQQQDEEYQRNEARKLREMQERVRAPRSSRSSYDDDFTDPAADNAIARAQRQRRQREIERIGRDLDADPYSSTYDTGRAMSGNGGSGYGNSGMPDYQGNGAEGTEANGSAANGGYNGTSNTGYGNNTGSSTSQDGEEVQKVVKKERASSDYFNTVGRDRKKSKLISAIIDENIKAVDGSRVRLRLLDDVEIGDLTVKKGTYLYATMSGFGQQRVKGTIQSIFYDEEIIKVSLSIYDTDGLEGLYVPESEFRTTAKDIGSSAMSSNQIIDQTTTSNTGIKSWASQAAQNASQKVMSAIGKVIKKNRVKLKYGTKVYLVDGSQERSHNGSRRSSNND